MVAWYGLTLGLLLSLPAQAGLFDNLPPLVLEADEFASYSCEASGEPIYLPRCAWDATDPGCSFLAGEVIATGVILPWDHTVTAVSMGPALGGEHRFWEAAISTEPANFDVDPACRDESVPGGHLNPRILFQPRFPAGCPQPETDTIWLNVRPVGHRSTECGTTRRCTVLVYGP